MGLSDLPADQLAAWVEASCAAQGVPTQVTDSVVVRRVVVLMGGGAGPSASASAERGARTADALSKPPNRLDPVGVERAGALSAWGDDRVVEDRGDDGVLTSEAESGPLRA